MHFEAFEIKASIGVCVCFFFIARDNARAYERVIAGKLLHNRIHVKHCFIDVLRPFFSAYSARFFNATKKMYSCV